VIGWLLSIVTLAVLFLALGGWWLIWGYFYTKPRRRDGAS
jgi:hypothetical protein